MFRFMVLAASSLFPFLFPPPSLAGFPSCDESQATADYDILCPANAAEVLHVLIDLRDAFGGPVDGWTPFVRCASPAGTVEMPTLAPTSWDGLACVSTTVGELIDTDCCDSLEVVVYNGPIVCTFPVDKAVPPAPTKPVGYLSAATVPSVILTPTNSGEEIRIVVDLRGPCNEPIAGWPADSVCVECEFGPGPVCADGPSEADGRSTITTTIGALVGTQACPDLLVRVCGAPLTCFSPVTIVATDAPEVGPSISALRLRASTPNPFHFTATLRYFLPTRGPVQLAVFDVRGRRVRLLVNESLPAGEHAAVWDGRDDAGKSVPSGVYFYRLEADGRAETKKVVRVTE